MLTDWFLIFLILLLTFIQIPVLMGENEVTLISAIKVD